MAPAFFSITLGFSQPTFADNFHEQPILVVHLSSSTDSQIGNDVFCYRKWCFLIQETVFPAQEKASFVL
jgi:hypothetical protein